MKKKGISLCAILGLMISCSETKKTDVNIDTLIFMEEAVQNMCFEQSIKAYAYTSDLKSEYYSAPNDEENSNKKSKIKMIMSKVEKIDFLTLKLIDYIDKIKYKLLRACLKIKLENVYEGVFLTKMYG